MRTQKLEMGIEVLSQGITNTGSGLDFQTISNVLVGVLTGAVVIIVLWRLFKNYLSSGKDGSDISPEERGKKQTAIIADAGIVVAMIVVAGVVIGWIASLIISFFQG